ncbi:MAG TPA: FMN-binding negative transcriptional regulator [Chitinophagaceae bacterium]
MYSLPYFKEHDPAVIMDFMRHHPFAMLMGCADNKPVATQIPVLLDQRDDKLFLRGHMMRQTDHHKAFENNPQVLAVFTSPHTYVSASWYENPHQGSTWNYISVHARGTMKFLDANGLIDVLKKTTLHFENNNPSSPTVFDNLPEEYTSKMMKAIIAFEIEVTEIENVFKLSQNRDEKSFHTIMGKLQQQGNEGAYIAGQMQRIEQELFSQNGKPE